MLRTIAPSGYCPTCGSLFFARRGDGTARRRGPHDFWGHACQERGRTGRKLWGLLSFLICGAVRLPQFVPPRGRAVGNRTGRPRRIRHNPDFPYSLPILLNWARRRIRYYPHLASLAWATCVCRGPVDPPTRSGKPPCGRAPHGSGGEILVHNATAFRTATLGVAARWLYRVKRGSWQI